MRQSVIRSGLLVIVPLFFLALTPSPLWAPFLFRKELPPVYTFTVELDGRPLGTFQEVSGLSEDNWISGRRPEPAEPRRYMSKYPSYYTVRNIVLRQPEPGSVSLLMPW